MRNARAACMCRARPALGRGRLAPGGHTLKLAKSARINLGISAKVWLIRHISGLICVSACISHIWPDIGHISTLLINLKYISHIPRQCVHSRAVV